MTARTIVLLLLLVLRIRADDVFSRAKALEDAGKTVEARAAFEELLRQQPNQPAVRAPALMELSRMDLAAGNYGVSVQRGQDAVAGFRSLHDRGGEGNALTITGLAEMYAGDYGPASSHFNQALKLARDTADPRQQITRLNNIGSVLYFQGRYADALNVLRDAMKLVDASPHEDWSAGRRQLTTANIAIIYQSLGQYDRALDTYSGVSSFSEDFKPQERAQLLANMGALYRRLGDPQKALETYRAAQQLYQRRALRRGEIAVLNNIGLAQALDMHRLPAALETFNEAVRLSMDSGDRLVALQSLLYRAEALYRMQRPAASRADLEKALLVAGSLQASEEKWKALFAMARLALQAGDSAPAISMLREAVALIESLRGSSPNALLGGFLADKRQVYDLLIRELARGVNPDVPELFRLMELSRSRTLQDKRKAAGQAFSLREVSGRLPAGSLLVEYWLGEDALVMLWADAAHSGIHVGTGVSGLRESLRHFHLALRDAASDRWQAEASSISDQLLGGVEKRLADPATKSLIFVPDREISLIPMEVLPLPQNAAGRVLDRFAVSYLPAASLFQASPAGRSLVPFWRRTLLALGDPSQGSSKVAAGSFAMPSARDARRLPAAAGEVRAAGRLTGGRVSIFTGSEATKDHLRQGLQLRFPLVHLATHAFTDTEDPARSYILLAGVGGTQAYDYLFLNEIRDLDLHGADLVTLSACETETGKQVEGEGTASFSRALLGSGARAVVTTLWAVGDQSGSELMSAFYAGLGRGASGAEALRVAKLQVAEGRYRHPFYWAAFLLNGEPGVTAPLVLGWPLLGAGALGLAGVTLLLWAWFKKPGQKASGS